MNNQPRQKLCELILQYGRSLCDEPKRCEGLLRDFCGQYRGEISVLISSLKEGVAADLLSSQKSIPIEIVLARLTQRLQKDLYLSEEAARWAVESWALALGIIANIPSKTPKSLTEDTFSSPHPNSLPSIDLQSPEPPEVQSQTLQTTPVYPNLPVPNFPTTQSQNSNSSTPIKLLPWAVVIGLAITAISSLILLNRTPSLQPISSPNPSSESSLNPSPNLAPTREPGRPTPIEFVRNYYAGINNHYYEETWNKLTNGKQRESQGWQSYLEWWNSVRSVQVDNIILLSHSDDTALLKADFSFSMENGRFSQENGKRIYLVWNHDSNNWLISDILSFNSLRSEVFPKSYCGDASLTRPFYRVYISDPGSLEKLKNYFCRDSLQKGDRIQVAAFDEYPEAQNFKEFMELHFNNIKIEEIE